METFDAIVIGAGPAGTALSSALSREGLSVALVDPEVGLPWPNNYGLWLDELPEEMPQSIFEATWDAPIVRFGGEPIELDRGYGRVDGERLRSFLSQDAPFEQVAAKVDEVHAGEVMHVTAGGRKLAAALVFDATGTGAFLDDVRPSEVAAQTAYGVIATVDGDPLDGAPMALMDFDASWRDPSYEGPATFLYAMKLGDRWFLEETVLVARPAHPIAALRDDLDRRLAARGATITQRFEEERCFIPMGTPLPSLNQRVVGFGASAGYVHPASGYSLARSLERAPIVARAVSDVVAEGMGDEELSRWVWRSVWPDERVRARRLYSFGMETLLTMDRRQTERFFEAFFALPEASWQGYLSDRLDARGVRAVMLRLFASADMQVRLSLAAAAMGRNGLQLLRALLG